MAKNIGSILKEKRLEKGLSLQDVSLKINVRVKYLEMLEEDIDSQETIYSVPIVYMLGYIKIYSNFLGLNGDEIVNILSSKVHHDDLQYISINNVEKQPNKKVLLMSLLCILLIIILWKSFDKFYN